MQHDSQMSFFSLLLLRINLKPMKVFYADDDENEIISTLFYIHKDLDACLIRTAADISQIAHQTPCINEVSINEFIPCTPV